MIPAGQFLYVSNPLGKVRSLRSQRLRGRPSGRMGSAPATGAVFRALAGLEPKVLSHQYSVISLQFGKGRAAEKPVISRQYSVISSEKLGPICPQSAALARRGHTRPAWPGGCD